MQCHLKVDNEETARLREFLSVCMDQRREAHTLHTDTTYLIHADEITGNTSAGLGCVEPRPVFLPPRRHFQNALHIFSPNKKKKKKILDDLGRVVNTDTDSLMRYRDTHTQTEKMARAAATLPQGGK
jgi:hypothetical protein